MKVNFMIIGAQKCATSTLFNILKTHPSMVGSSQKEPNFFSLSKNWKRELPDYEKLFDQKDGVLYFEASVSYSAYHLRNLEIWNDIFEYNPDMKFIYMVRNPIDRIVSNYMHSYEMGYINYSIEDILRKGRLLIDATRYYTQVNPYIQKFGRDNVLIIEFDDLNKKRTSTLQTISEFLGVEFDKFQNYENVCSNVSIGTHNYKIHYKYYKLLSPLRKLREFMPTGCSEFLMGVLKVITGNSKRSFRERPQLTTECKQIIVNKLDLEINELQKLMNKDLSHWKSIKQGSNS